MTNENRTTQEQENRYDYMDQKPQHSRKAFAVLGITLCAVVLLIGGFCTYGVSYVKNHADEIRQSPYGWIVADFMPDLMDTEEDVEKIYAGTGTTMSGSGETSEANQILNLLTTSDYDYSENEPSLPDSPAKDPEAAGDINDYAPEYTEKPIALALYRVEDNTVVTTSSDEAHAGYYVLDSDTVYAIRWDASPLYRNDDKKVNANIDVSSDFLIGGGIDGEGVITVSIRDYNRHINYVGELHVAAEDCNLGIEFCADACRIRAYGFHPQIQDEEFVVCFYTSGEYVESVYSSISGADGYYRYTYGTEGNEYLNDVVTRNADPRPAPMPVPTPSKDEPKDPVDGNIQPTKDPVNGNDQPTDEDVDGNFPR